MYSFFVISMKDDLNKRKRIKEMLGTKHDLRIVDAVTVKDVKEDYSKTFIGPTPIACAIFRSHLKALEMFLDDPRHLKGAFICEDDVVFNNRFDEKSKVYVDNIKGDMVVLFGCGFCKEENNDIVSRGIMKSAKHLLYYKKNSQLKEPERKDLFKRPEAGVGSHCYYVTRQSAIKILEYFSNNVRDHYDIALMKHPNINIFVTKDLFAGQNFIGNGSYNKKELLPAPINSYLESVRFDTDNQVSASFVLNSGYFYIRDLDLIITWLHIVIFILFLLILGITVFVVSR